MTKTLSMRLSASTRATWYPETRVRPLLLLTLKVPYSSTTVLPAERLRLSTLRTRLGARQTPLILLPPGMKLERWKLLYPASPLLQVVPVIAWILATHEPTVPGTKFCLP